MTNERAKEGIYWSASRGRYIHYRPGAQNPDTIDWINDRKPLPADAVRLVPNPAVPQSGDVVMTVPVTIDDDGTITLHDTGRMHLAEWWREHGANFTTAPRVPQPGDRVRVQRHPHRTGTVSGEDIEVIEPAPANDPSTRDDVSSPCCDLHQPGNCCEPFDCGPCCRNCPDCPSHNHTRRPRVWFDGDTIPAGVRVIAENGDVRPDPDDMDEEWENGNLGPLVEFTVDYDAEVAHARREREGGDQ